MQASHRLTHLLGGGSDGWGVFLRARDMIATGTPVVELTIGEHDIRTDPSILAAMNASAVAGNTGYAAVPGIGALRTKVAERISLRTGVPTDKSNILITPGGQAGLFATHIAAINAGDTALFIDPYYTTYPGTIRGVGGIPVAVEARPRHGFQPQADVIDAAARTHNARSLLVNSPNNPTGVVYSRATLDGIADVAKARDLWLISDEVYDTQIWDGDHISPRSLPGMIERTMVVGSMSKSHAMTGSRVGWICAPAEIVTHLINLATHTTYGVAGFVQAAALFALEAGADLEQKIADPFRRRRGITLDLLAAQNIVKGAPLQGAMYTMLDIRATDMTGEEFANALLDHEHIAVMPGESFGKAAAGHIRVAMTIEDEAYRAALARVLQFAAARA